MPRMEPGSGVEFEGIIGASPRMAEMFARIRRIAPLTAHADPGATGTGKDLVARALHARSGVKGQYVVLNCSAVVETLFESELFGHVRGAFTGADRDKPGLFEAATEALCFSMKSATAHRDAGQAAASAAESGISASARRVAQSQRACHRGNAQKSAPGRGRPAVSRGPLLPSRHGRNSRSFFG